MANSGIFKGKLTPINSRDPRLEFQYNPTSINESRLVRYNFSEGQGQILPFVQYGMVEPTEINFELFMLKNSGLSKEIQQLRGLTLPKQISRLTHYQQVSPHKYFLELSGYGTFIGVVNSVDISVDQMKKTDMTPVRLTANITFTVVSGNLNNDISHLQTMSGRRR